MAEYPSFERNDQLSELLELCHEAKTGYYSPYSKSYLETNDSQHVASEETTVQLGDMPGIDTALKSIYQKHGRLLFVHGGRNPSGNVVIKCVLKEWHNDPYPPDVHERHKRIVMEGRPDPVLKHRIIVLPRKKGLKVRFEYEKLTDYRDRVARRESELSRQLAAYEARNPARDMRKAEAEGGGVRRPSDRSDGDKGWVDLGGEGDGGDDFVVVSDEET